MEFSANFQKLYDRTKACIYSSGAYFELKKKYVSSSRVFDLKQKSVLKLLDRTVYTQQQAFTPHKTATSPVLKIVFPSFIRKTSLHIT